MPTYRVEGAHQETGKDTVDTVTADSVEDAESIAYGRGLYVLKTTELKTNTSQPDSQPNSTPTTTVIQQSNSSQALPALVNIFLPGVGQLIQGRILAAFLWWLCMIVSSLFIFVFIGIITTPIVYFACIVEAAVYKPKIDMYKS